MMSNVKSHLKKATSLFLLLAMCIGFSGAYASENQPEEQHEAPSGKFNPAEMIIHHISDSYDWHILGEGHQSISVPLPVIIYSNTKGLQVFLSSEFHHGSQPAHGYLLEHGHLKSEDPNEKFYDLSITKNVASMLVSALLLMIIFLTVAASYGNKLAAPRGLQAVIEPLIVFVRDEIAIPNIGEKKAYTFLPYLLTAFFFIWMNNLLGLLPSGANASGNIAFTFTLAFLTLIITNFSGNKGYWGHILKAPGVPIPLLIIMTPVEIIGIFTKPFALMIRLFANITAGHIIILSILSFIFIFKSYAVAAVSLPFALVMSMMEVFVAALQAYIFTLLSALFIGQAVAEHEHHDDHH